MIRGSGWVDRVTKGWGLDTVSAVVSRFVRKVRTASGAVAVQVVTKAHGKIVELSMSARRTPILSWPCCCAARERVLEGRELDLGPVHEARVDVEGVADWDAAAGRRVAIGCSGARRRGWQATTGGQRRVVGTVSPLLWTCWARLMTGSAST